jgi:hypothetical protein
LREVRRSRTKSKDPSAIELFNGRRELFYYEPAQKSLPEPETP